MHWATKSTMAAKETIEHEGKTLPYIKVDISSASHRISLSY